jgi:hypothetical protein
LLLLLCLWNLRARGKPRPVSPSGGNEAPSSKCLV